MLGRWRLIWQRTSSKWPLRIGPDGSSNGNGSRARCERFLDELPAGTEVVMEACGTARYWGRRCQARGLAVLLLPAQYLRPYVRRNNTDRTDTEAVLDAGRRMRRLSCRLFRSTSGEVRPRCAAGTGAALHW